MKLALTRTAKSKGLIYEVADTTGKKIWDIERDVSQHNVWLLHFHHDSHSVQAVMCKDEFSAEFQTEGGRFHGRITEPCFSVAGKAFVENESGVCLGSLTSYFSTWYFKDGQGKKNGFARRVVSKKFFVPPSKAHTFWNYDVEIDDATYDERLLFALVCSLVASEFGTSAAS